jgi:hypothetical protein
MASFWSGFWQGMQPMGQNIAQAIQRTQVSAQQKAEQLARQTEGRQLGILNAAKGIPAGPARNKVLEGVDFGPYQTVAEGLSMEMPAISPPKTFTYNLPGGGRELAMLFEDGTLKRHVLVQGEEEWTEVPGQFFADRGVAYMKNRQGQVRKVNIEPSYSLPEVTESVSGGLQVTKEKVSGPEGTTTSIIDVQATPASSKEIQAQRKQMISEIRQLPAIDKAAEIERSYAGLKAILKDMEQAVFQGTGTAGYQYAAVQLFQRLLDPATVREGDIALMRSAQSRFENLVLQLERTVKGQFVNTGLLKSFGEVADTVVEAHRATAKDAVDTYLNSAMIPNLGYDPAALQSVRQFTEIYTRPVYRSGSSRLTPAEEARYRELQEMGKNNRNALGQPTLPTEALRDEYKRLYDKKRGQ